MCLKKFKAVQNTSVHGIYVVSCCCGRGGVGDVHINIYKYFTTHMYMTCIYDKPWNFLERIKRPLKRFPSPHLPPHPVLPQASPTIFFTLAIFARMYVGSKEGLVLNGMKYSSTHLNLKKKSQKPEEIESQFLKTRNKFTKLKYVYD